MNYIVLDLEWNQSSTKAEEKEIPFEVIEIGAVKLDEHQQMVSQFSELIRPQIYTQMHQITSRLIHLKMEELQKGHPFLEVMERFLDWCGEDYIFVTWGPLDLTELQRNMNYYKMEPLADAPFPFYDAQKLFSLALEDGKSRRSLEYAIDFLHIKKDIPFHRAFSDAYYTAKVFAGLHTPAVLENVSYDTYHLPKSRKEEIHHQFSRYAKYISREFTDKAEAMEDHEVASSKCYLCHRNLRKKIKWFTNNGRNYFCVAYCEKHGFLKCKVRIRYSDEGKAYVVKTSRLIGQEELQEVQNKKKHAHPEKEQT